MVSLGAVGARPRPRWRLRLHEVIFESDTAAGRAFDVALLIAILISVAAVLLESVAEVRREHGPALRAVEWALTIAFTIEYALRLTAVERPWRYATSFFGIVDLLSIVPTYLALVVPETQSLMVIRAIRLLRVFRILKAAQFLSEAQLLTTALRASRRKITVFIGAIVTVVLIVGALMYVIEGEVGRHDREKIHDPEEARGVPPRSLHGRQTQPVLDGERDGERPFHRAQHDAILAPDLGHAFEDHGGHAGEDGDQQRDIEGASGNRVGLEDHLVQPQAPARPRTRRGGAETHHIQPPERVPISTTAMRTKAS